MIFLQPNWIIAFVCAFTYFGMGKAEARGGGHDNGMLWAGLSIATSALLISTLNAGWLVVVLGQVGLFIGIAIFRTLRDK